jgi:uncharacterized Zn finger protein (UPF0148 family)
MDTKDVVVTCPCCESRLEVDARTGKVVKWRPKGELDETGKPKIAEKDWDDASTRVGKRMGGAAERFEDGLSKEKNRERDLDELFRKAREKAEGGGE